MPVKDWLPAAVRDEAIDRKLKSGEALFRLGNKATGLYEVISGRVRLARVDRSGHEIVLHIAGPGEALAEVSLFSPSYHCDARQHRCDGSHLSKRRRCLPPFTRTDMQRKPSPRRWRGR